MIYIFHTFKDKGVNRKDDRKILEYVIDRIQQLIGYNVRTFSMLDLPIKDSAPTKPIIREDIKEDSTLVS